MSLGSDHSCAVREDGVSCWGRNHLGQAGAAPGDTTIPHRVIPGTFIEISAGQGHVCVLDGRGVVSCWGANGSGQLGRRSRTETELPGPAPAFATATHVSAGRAHTCVVLDSRAAECVGASERGQSGIVADQIVDPNEITGPWDDINAGGSFTCARREDVIFCFGANGSGQTGTPWREDQHIPARIIRAGF